MPQRHERLIPPFVALSGRRPNYVIELIPNRRLALTSMIRKQSALSLIPEEAEDNTASGAKTEAEREAEEGDEGGHDVSPSDLAACARFWQPHRLLLLLIHGEFCIDSNFGSTTQSASELRPLRPGEPPWTCLLDGSAIAYLDISIAENMVERDSFGKPRGVFCIAQPCTCFLHNLARISGVQIHLARWRRPPISSGRSLLALNV